MNGWTAADQAELDVLAHTLTFNYSEHRKKCRACQPCERPQQWKEHKRVCRVCQGDAPLTYGATCPERDAHLAHNRECPACAGPCPHLQAAIGMVLDWRDTRALVSKAEALRHDLADLPWCCNALSIERGGVTHYYHRPDCRFPWQATETRDA